MDLTITAVLFVIALTVILTVGYALGYALSRGKRREFAQDMARVWKLWVGICTTVVLVMLLGDLGVLVVRSVVGG